MRSNNSRFGKTKLRLCMLSFFVTLAIPTIILVIQAYSQLKWESFHQHRILAEELTNTIDSRLSKIISTEEARPFTDYAFLNLLGDPAANYIQRSTLSELPLNTNLPGVIGYFQIDAEDRFSTPLLPTTDTGISVYGITESQETVRHDLQTKIFTILNQNQLIPDNETTGEILFVENKPKSAMEESAEETSEIVEQMLEASEGEWGVDDNVELSPAVKNLAMSPSDSMSQAPMQGARALDYSPTAGNDSAAEEDWSQKPYQKNKRSQEKISQSAFDRLSKEPSTISKPKKNRDSKADQQLGRVEDLRLDEQLEQRSQLESNQQATPKDLPQSKSRVARKETGTLPEAPIFDDRTRMGGGAVKTEFKVRTFVSEIDPFEVSLLDSGHFVLYRKVWRDGQRFIQGLVIDMAPFIDGVIKQTYQASAVASMSSLVSAYHGNVLSVLTGTVANRYQSKVSELNGALLFRGRLSAPFNDLELIYSVTELPAGAGGSLLTWVSLILGLVLFGGTYFMYRLGLRQLSLANQQQDFVSAVSHELRTPITSIRMYGEMLIQGWASEEKKQEYYKFIFDESERLSRLIANVLQLARMNRNDLQVDLKSVSIAEVMDNVRSKIHTQVERSGFELELNIAPSLKGQFIRIDMDMFTQIIINLVDNALKFSIKSEIKIIEISCKAAGNKRVIFCVRDHGPGIAKNKLKKIFQLFYRSEDELTRETVGTGIGLALVHQLTAAMNGVIDVINRDPGSEFSLSFPLASASLSR